MLVDVVAATTRPNPAGAVPGRLALPDRGPHRREGGSVILACRAQPMARDGVGTLSG